MTSSHAPEQPNPYSTPAASTAGANSAARIAFILSIVLLVLAVVQTIVSQFLPLIMADLALGVSQVGFVFAIIGIVSLCLAIVTVVAGVLGARQSTDRVKAGIGIGVGGFVGLTALVSLVLGPIIQLVY